MPLCTWVFIDRERGETELTLLQMEGRLEQKGSQDIGMLSCFIKVWEQNYSNNYSKNIKMEYFFQLLFFYIGFYFDPSEF